MDDEPIYRNSVWNLCLWSRNESLMLSQSKKKKKKKITKMWTGPVCSEGQHLDETVGDSELTPSSDRRWDHRQRERPDQRSENRITLRHPGLTGRHQAASHLDDFLHPWRADHVGVRVEANLVHNGAVALQDHEGPVHHATRASFKRETMTQVVVVFLNTDSAKVREPWERKRKKIDTANMFRDAKTGIAAII